MFAQQTLYRIYKKCIQSAQLHTILFLVFLLHALVEKTIFRQSFKLYVITTFLQWQFYNDGIPCYYTEVI